MEITNQKSNESLDERPSDSPMEQLSAMPSFEEHMATRQSKKPKYTHDHTPSRHPAFLKAQAIAREKGQRMVNDEKRDYIYSHEIEQRVTNGEDVNAILEKTNGDGVYLHAEEFLDNGADVEKIFEYMPKDVRWLKIDALAKHGYDINKLADKLSDTAIWLNADKFVEYGADLDRLKQRLSSKDEYLKSLVERGELFNNPSK